MPVFPLSILFLLVPLALEAQQQSLPSDTLLAGVTERGRQLAAYDQAAWHATDAVMALHPDMSSLNTMLAIPDTVYGWRVLFGRLGPGHDTLFSRYEALQAGRPDSFVAQHHDPMVPFTGVERRMAGALLTGGAAYGTPKRAYNSYVLTRPDRSFWVYFMPAQTDNEFPHGADVRFLVSEDGQQILDQHRMHNGILNQALSDSAVMGFHTVVVDDVPQDSDVFLVLARQPRKPEYIVTKHYLYKISVDGTISWRADDKGSAH